MPAPRSAPRDVADRRASPGRWSATARADPRRVSGEICSAVYEPDEGTYTVRLRADPGSTSAFAVPRACFPAGWTATLLSGEARLKEDAERGLVWVSATGEVELRVGAP